MNSINRLVDNIEKVIVGKRPIIEMTVIALLCRGHVLLEDVPGLGKTMLARTLAKSVALSNKRLQFTPDLLPSDVTGVPVYNQRTSEFEFRPGPIFTNILLADEINRATPRAQSSLLECMEEFQVSADGITYPLPKVFMVIATQNPIELLGTYVLPEAQMDRFIMRLSMGYPSVDEEIRIIQDQADSHPIDRLTSVIDEAEIVAARTALKAVYIEASVLRYIAEITAATRAHPDLRLGASPRGTLALVRASQGLALLSEQRFVTPNMVKKMADPVLTHRLIVRTQAAARGQSAQAILGEILAQRVPPV